MTQTHKGTVEQEIVYARILTYGKPENMYLELMKVNGADIAQELSEFFTGLGIVDWKARIVRLGTDDASVNMGCHGGLGTVYGLEKRSPLSSTDPLCGSLATTQSCRCM